MKIVLLVGLAHSVELMAPEEYQFMKYISDHGRNYPTKEEYKFRLGLFKERLQKYSEHNSNPNKTFTVGVNHFSDRTKEEIDVYRGYIPDKTYKKNIWSFPEEAMADSINWVEKGAVTKIKDQGACGSCWTFSAAGTMESNHFIASGLLFDLSEQNFVDCVYHSKKEYHSGCHGGQMRRALTYAETHPLMTLHDYPYTAETWEGECKYQKKMGAV